jgi:hypothetical protein
LYEIFSTAKWILLEKFKYADKLSHKSGAVCMNNHNNHDNHSNNTNHNLEYLIYKVRYEDTPEEQKRRLETKKILDEFVRLKEANGIRVHYAERDVDQDDPTGFRICSEHSIAMRDSIKVDMWYDPTSHGSVFDMGMGFMAGKPLEILNIDSIKEITNDYEQFLKDYSLNGALERSGLQPSPVYRRLYDKREIIKHTNVPSKFVWRKNDWEVLFEFGMLFLAEKPIMLLNRPEVEAEAQALNRKCYQKVLLLVDDMYK